MSVPNTKLEVVNETSKNNLNLDQNVLEQVFGKPNSPRSTADSHLINNESNKTEPNRSGTSLVVPQSRTSQPLLEPERDKQPPPLAGPETDDLDEEVAAHNAPTPGIDDGLLEPIDKHPGDRDKDADNGGHQNRRKEGDDSGTEDGKWSWRDEPDYAYDVHNGLSNRLGGDSRPVSPVPTTIDVNTYQQKKNLAQGMMDLALLSANANQLRYVLESAQTHPYYYSSLIFISLSIIFQVAVGVGLIMNSRYDVNDKKEICKADKINNFTVLGIFLITIVNVFITSFGVATPPPAPGTAVVVQNG